MTHPITWVLVAGNESPTNPSLRGETQVRLRLELPREFSVLLDVSAKVKPDREFRAVVEEICGPEAIEKVAG